MARKSPPKIRATATAKLEAVAKATYEHKKTVTEIVPADVIRAKASKWLDLISPITEWAGLKGDALRFHRMQLRIQQEAALEQLAKEIHSNMDGKEVVHPIPPKILVPSLEAASLESPSSPLIKWWARMLISSATQEPIRPYLIDLMSKMGVDETRFLEEPWSYCLKGPIANLYRESGPVLSRPGRIEFLSAARVSSELMPVLEKFMAASMEERTGLWTSQAKDVDRVAVKYGVGIDVMSRDTEVGWTTTSQNVKENGICIDVCRALNLLNWYEFSDAGHTVRVLQFTELGAEFMRATH